MLIVIYVDLIDKKNLLASGFDPDIAVPDQFLP